MRDDEMVCPECQNVVFKNGNHICVHFLDQGSPTRYPTPMDALGAAVDISARLRKLRGETRQIESIAVRMTQEDREREQQRIQSAYEIAERIVERLRKTHMTRDELMPKWARVSCVACRDTGIEECLEEGNPIVRPCIHCVTGDKKLEQWQESWADEWIDEAKRKHTFTNGGPYSRHEIGVGTNAREWVPARTTIEIEQIRNYPCAHGPITWEHPRIGPSESTKSMQKQHDVDPR